MAKEKFSWTKPDGIPGLIGRKRVDWSIFDDGTHIPRDFIPDFLAANGGQDLDINETRNLTLLIEGKEYEAKFCRDTRGTAFEIRYSANRPLRQVLCDRFKQSYDYLFNVRAASEHRRVHHIVPDTQAEFMEFHETGKPFRYEVKLLPSDGTRLLTGFDKVWADLGAIIGEGREVLTLREKARNHVRWSDAGLEVTTAQGTDTIDRSVFEQAWSALHEAGLITADQLPGRGKYHSAALMASLALLPYVDHTVQPRITLSVHKNWIFQANPKIHNAWDAVKGLRELHWLVNQYADKIHPGHTVFLWESGENAGVIAVATVLTEPAAIEETNEGKDYWIVSESSHLAGPKLRVQLRVEKVVNPRVPRKLLVNHQVLKDALIIRRPTGTNFPLTPEEANALWDLVGDNPTEPQPLPTLAAVVSRIGAALKESHLDYGPRHDDLVRAFVTALATKRLAILTGLSGSGKTQLALRFGQWLGEGRCLLQPVRPDWTGAEALFGYEDALLPADGARRAWHVPTPLAFMLRAARDLPHPYLLILDEMNLAHVERYFADVLSGMETDEPCLPNISQDPTDGLWRVSANGPARIPFPRNLFVVGTVNVDETTYMFSPKVLDRANTFEFRVESTELTSELRKPVTCAPGEALFLRSFMAHATDDDWQNANRPPDAEQYVTHLRTLHELLYAWGFEFGHRTFYEALRFAALLSAAGNPNLEHALDLQVMQKVLPRLHGTRRRLESLLCLLGQFCFELRYTPAPEGRLPTFNPLGSHEGRALLPRSFDKVKRMTRNLRANQFTGFTE